VLKASSDLFGERTCLLWKLFTLLLAVMTAFRNWEVLPLLAYSLYIIVADRIGFYRGEKGTTF